MPRNPTMTEQLAELWMDLKQEFHALANEDGVITAHEAEVDAMIGYAGIKIERIYRSQIMAKNVLDNAEINDNVLRQDRELKRDIALLERDLAPVVSLCDYRDARTADSTA